MTEREPMSSKEQLKEAYMAGVAHHTNEEVGFPEETFSRWYDALASTEPERPASEGEDLTCEYCQTKMLVTRANIGDEYTMALCPNLLCPGLEPPTTEGEQLVERFWQEFAGEGPITDRVARRMVEWVLAQPQERGERIERGWAYKAPDGRVMYRDVPKQPFGDPRWMRAVVILYPLEPSTSEGG